MLEEDSDDRYLTKDTLSVLKLDFPLQFFSDSRSLIAALEHQQGPGLVLIDYNLSSETGVAVLQQIKSHTALKHFPVVILSESVLPRYIRECYAAGASSVVQKPDSLMATHKTIETFFRYWLEVAEL